MQSDALQHIDQAGVRVDALQAAGHHEALQESRLLSAQFGPTNKPFFRPMGITRKARSKWWVSIGIGCIQVQAGIHPPSFMNTPTGIYACMDAGGKAAPGTSGQGGEGMAGFIGWRVWLCLLSFPLCGNGWSQPLDSSAFVPDTALPPASMQAGLRRNDGGGRFQPVPVSLSGCRSTSIASSSFRRRPESRRAGPGCEGMAGFAGWRVRLL